jgi:hypothetical protein
MLVAASALSTIKQPIAPRTHNQLPKTIAAFAMPAIAARFAMASTDVSQTGTAIRAPRTSWLAPRTAGNWGQMKFFA